MSTPPATPGLSRASHAFGWLADRRLPVPLRGLAFRTWALATGSRLAEARLPLAAHRSLGELFVRRLGADARPFDDDPSVVPSPVDGRVQARQAVSAGTLLQAKGRPYPVAELLAGAARDAELEGAGAVTVYLAPRDYHRIHAPLDAELHDVRWVPGTRYSVNPATLAKRAKVLSVNERAVLGFRAPSGPFWMVLVGALNVGRVRVVGVPTGASPARPLVFRRGDELARFEMGSTVVLVRPGGLAGPEVDPALPGEGEPVRMGRALARLPE